MSQVVIPALILEAAPHIARAIGVVAFFGSMLISGIEYQIRKLYKPERAKRIIEQAHANIAEKDLVTCLMGIVYYTPEKKTFDPQDMIREILGKVELYKKKYSELETDFTRLLDILHIAAEVI